MHTRFTLSLSIFSNSVLFYNPIVCRRFDETNLQGATKKQALKCIFISIQKKIHKKKFLQI